MLILGMVQWVVLALVLGAASRRLSKGDTRDGRDSQIIKYMIFGYLATLVTQRRLDKFID